MSLKENANKYEGKISDLNQSSTLLKEKAKNVLLLSQKWNYNAIWHTKCSPVSFEMPTTKNKTQSSFNLSQTETEKLIDSWYSKVPHDLPRPTSTIKRSDRNTSSNKISDLKAITLTKAKNEPSESEQVEFNVYDFTHAKDWNNTTDTAEFGDIEKEVSHKVRILQNTFYTI